MICKLFFSENTGEYLNKKSENIIAPSTKEEIKEFNSALEDIKLTNEEKN